MKLKANELATGLAGCLIVGMGMGMLWHTFERYQIRLVQTAICGTKVVVDFDNTELARDLLAKIKK